VNTEYRQDEYELMKERADLLIRQLTSQLEYQVRRNKDLEAVVKGQAQKATVVIEELRKHAEDEIVELSLRLEKSEQVNKELQSLISQENVLNPEVTILRDFIPRITSKEDNNRVSQEEGIALKQEIDKLREELKVYKETSDKVKSKVEAENQKLISKVHSIEMELNKIEQEKANLIRTVNSLNSTKGIIETATEELKKENLELKQVIIELEKKKTSLTIKLDKADRDYKALKLELIKADNIIKLQVETIKELQNDYSNLLNKEESYSMLPVRRDALSNIVDEENSIKKETKLQAGNERRSLYQQEDINTRYEEYRQRQSVSALVDVPNKRNASCNRRQYSKERSPEYKKLNTSNNCAMPSDKFYADNKEQIDKLQSNLQMLLTEKIKLDKEFSKFGSRPEKSIVQKKRKEELEFEIDLNEKNIQRVKFRLRELNAFTN
jgi:hypothetical protein